ncbi:uncharacterized protein BDR25DRAFT_281672 [Lindgomyces ingoldianus]|uniref:Uncharacterized protein n=1 Tax=Lindgomyces ingoldianus TaxID=673940 RepID=A0ACB6R385_9PLEO|nr:uncharacterized protein BDR25DRAFT_281672 [Lindgomyces ingoldianus]KAF2473748.1 hypothetical protein BDR25DRAFT_281672 [Lindgomyces ingoldianus]
MAPRKGTRRACDPCSVRKVRCNGDHPCSRCIAASWECTYLKTHGKSGPKGPRRTTEAAIRRLQERNRSDIGRSRSESEASIDDGSPSIIDFPLLDSLPPTSDPDYDARLNGIDWPDTIASPTFPGAQREPERISISSVGHYLDIYQTRGYAIWPVVDTEALLARILTHQEDMEAYGLSMAVCAATISQFQIDAESGSAVEGHYRISSGLFEMEAKRARKAFDHMEHVTIWSLLSSFFLHVYSANIGRMSASTVFLGEAITKAHMIGLHQLSYYQPIDVEQQQHNLRIYWLLFITERAHSIQHDMPIMLRRAPDLPPLEDLKDGTVTPAFVQLCRLFNILDMTITAGPSGARQALALAQQQLNDDVASQSLNNEIQRADISITQQWMRVFLWQHALSVTNLRSTNENDEFSFSFPAKVAQNVLRYMSSLSRESLEAHGPGMETKLFDIANSLADVMICVPAINHESHFWIGPRDLIHSLSSLLASFRGGNPAVIRILQEKLTTLGLWVSSPQKLIDISSSEDEHEDWGGNQRSLVWSENVLIPPMQEFPSRMNTTL